jgi:cell division protein ZapB
VSKNENPEAALENLEQQIDALISKCQLLHDNNTQLKQHQQVLVEKTEKARSRVEAMISRLKTLDDQL